MRKAANSAGLSVCDVIHNPHQAAPSACVFSVAQFPGLPPVAALVARSVALVRAVAAGGGSLVGFVAGPCPAGVSPSPSPSRCFCGGGSGTWAELALGVGLGVQVIVFWCAPGLPQLPAWSGGRWAPVAVGGVVVSRQRPPTAQGTAFLALEDEEGLVNVILKPQVFEASREALQASFVVVEGRVQRQGQAVSVLGQRVVALAIETE